MSFVTGLVGSLTQGVNAFTNRELERQNRQQLLSEEIANRQAMQPVIARERQAAFEQDQRFKDQAQPDELRRKEAEMNFIADVQRRITEAASSIKIKTTPGLREALAAGDLGKASQFVVTKGDEDFVVAYQKMARDMINNSPYEKESARQRAITEAKQQRIKLGIEKAPGLRGGGSGTQAQSGGRLSPITDKKTNNKRLAAIDKSIEDAKSDIADVISDYNSAKAEEKGRYQKEYSALIKQLRELEATRNALTGNEFGVITEEEKAQAESYLPKTQQQTGKPVPAKQKRSAYNQIGDFFAKWAKLMEPGVIQRRLENGRDISRPPAAVSKPSLQGTSLLQSPAMSRQPSTQEALKAQKFNDLVNTISTQLKRQLSNDERGFIASGIYDGSFDNLVFDFNEGTFTKPGANSKRPVKDLVDSNIGDFAAENSFQFIPNFRSAIAEALRGPFLTDKGVEAFSK